MARTWRAERRTAADGTGTWRLSAGYVARGQNSRVRLNLGPVTEAEAQTALAQMQVEEDGGNADRVLAFADTAGTARVAKCGFRSS